MNTKEIQTRLNIIKSAVEIGDTDTIFLQSSRLKTLNIKKIDEITALLDSKNYRQALYLIKTFLSENDMLDSASVDSFDDNSEKVLNIEDMLKMSPLAKETIKEYKSNTYTQDDLEAFAKNIEVPISKAYEQEYVKPENYEDTLEKIQQVQESEEEEPKDIVKETTKSAEAKTKEKSEESIEVKEEIKSDKVENKEELNEFDSAVENVDKDTPLDEISAQVLGKKDKKPRKKVMSKYKTLRAKFARKEKTKNSDTTQGLKKSNVAKSVLNKAKNISSKIGIPEFKKSVAKKSDIDEINKKEETKKSSEQKPNSKSVKQTNDIYSPIPHIEQKFRQAFVLFPPNKESDVWVEEVIKFLKFVSANSYTEKDIKRFFEEYNFFIEKGDIARASQVLLLASATDSKYAKFLLARELFQGRVLKRDLKKSYTLMKDLANQFYPDAICDLAQFYEYGIGVPKDKKTAIKLYEKAFELGVDRATKHINRIKESGGFLSSLLKFK